MKVAHRRASNSLTRVSFNVAMIVIVAKKDCEAGRKARLVGTSIQKHGNQILAPIHQVIDNGENYRPLKKRRINQNHLDCGENPSGILFWALEDYGDFIARARGFDFSTGLLCVGGFCNHLVAAVIHHHGAARGCGHGFANFPHQLIVIVHTFVTMHAIF